MPRGMPGGRGHGDLQGGVPLALLRRTAATALGLCLRTDLLVGAPRLARSRPRELLHADAGALRPRQGPGGRGAAEAAPRLRAGPFQEMVSFPKDRSGPARKANPP